jgi:hypothetical protein
MNVRAALIAGLILMSAIPANAGGDKKKGDRAMVEKMESVPCGAREKGVTGLGTVWASAGITHVDNDEKLCPQYMVITDQMEYHIRPTDTKHPSVLPVGKEIIFKIKKDHMILKAADGDNNKQTTYLVVAVKPNSEVSASAKSNNP